MSASGLPELAPGLAYDALTLPLEHEPLPAEQVISGRQTTGSAVLEERDGRTIGVWEITPGVSTDVEADEVFVVLAGRGRVEFDGGDVIDISPGSVVRLTEGMRTTWTITETLRKLYIA